MDWLPGWWGPLVCVAWGIAIGSVFTLVAQDWRMWVQNERGRHAAGDDDEE